MNKGGRRAVGSMLVALMLTTACGADGPKVLSADDLAEEINGVCRTADRALGDLDADDDHYFDDVSDTLQVALDSLAKLKPSKDMKADFDDLVVNLGDQQDQLAELSTALEDDDADAGLEAGDELASLQDASDELTEYLGSRSCFGADSIVVKVELSADELVDEMNRICVAADKKLYEADFDDVSKFWSDLADVYAEVRDDLAVLEPPASLANDYAELLDDMDKIVAALRELSESSSFDSEAKRAAGDLASAKATEIGSDDCADLAAGGFTLGS